MQKNAYFTYMILGSLILNSLFKRNSYPIVEANLGGKKIVKLLFVCFLFSIKVPRILQGLFLFFYCLLDFLPHFVMGGIPHSNYTCVGTSDSKVLGHTQGG